MEGILVELFICVFANLRGIKGACYKTQKVLTGRYTKTSYAFKRKELHEAPEDCTPPLHKELRLGGLLFTVIHFQGQFTYFLFPIISYAGNATSMAENLVHDIHHYGFSGGPKMAAQFDFSTLKSQQDSYVARLNKIYETGLTKAGADIYRGFGSLINEHTFRLSTPSSDNASAAPSPVRL
jgi:hypothetical protein